MAFVYWFHFKEHDDIKTQGYVGITSGKYRRRWREHKSSLLRGIHPNSYFQNVVNKYGFDSLEFTVICECTEEYAKELEEKLRPQPKIGWNLMKGGEANWEHVPFTEERRKFQSEMVKNLWKDPEYRESRTSTLGRKASEETKLKQSAGIKNFYKDRTPPPPYKQHRAKSEHCKPIWLMADYIFEMWSEGKGDRVISKSLGHENRNSTIYKICKLFNSGWIPSEDQEWIDYREETNDSLCI